MVNPVKFIFLNTPKAKSLAIYLRGFLFLQPRGLAPLQSNSAPITLVYKVRSDTNGLRALVLLSKITCARVRLRVCVRDI